MPSERASGERHHEWHRPPCEYRDPEPGALLAAVETAGRKPSRTYGKTPHHAPWRTGRGTTGDLSAIQERNSRSEPLCCRLQDRHALHMMRHREMYERVNRDRRSGPGSRPGGRHLGTLSVKRVSRCGPARRGSRYGETCSGARRARATGDRWPAQRIRGPPVTRHRGPCHSRQWQCGPPSSAFAVTAAMHSRSGTSSGLAVRRALRDSEAATVAPRPTPWDGGSARCPSPP